ncbi:hypothetical protein HN682_07845 [Candidatus Peregrinibacteria bacterium]|jgi:hypothetical protein|nr:hypothetical protein [Candidatus Peregrinibacteria bacterium]
MKQICARKECNDIVTKGPSTKVFCSRRCSDLNKKKRKRLARQNELGNAECKYCGSQFNKKHSQNIFCSKSCQIQNTTRTTRDTEKCKQARRDLLLLRRIDHIKFTIKYKLDTGCQICGYSKNPHAMDFHHVVGEKEFLISQGCTVPIPQLIAEIEKCAVLCSNCHRELHHPL